MGDGPRGIEFFSDHFQVSTSIQDSPQSPRPSPSPSVCDRNVNSYSSTHRSNNSSRAGKLRSATSMLKLFNLRALTWGSGLSDQEKVVLTAGEVASLRSEITELEERSAHLKAQIEHIDEVLRSARLSGYLFMRTRWAALPGEPPTLDDNEVDDWLPRFLVLHGSCFFLYLSSTDLSPQDSTLLSDVIEVSLLPSIIREDGERRYCFCIMTRQGLRYECSSNSQAQVNSWLTALQTDCKYLDDLKKT